MQEHWIKNIEGKWVICYDKCIICKSNVTLAYPGVRTYRRINSLKLEIMDRSHPQKKFTPFYQIKEYEDLLNNLKRPTFIDFLSNSTSKLKI